MEHNIYIYIAVMALVTYAIRVLPLTLIRKEIKNPFIRSFLYYVPYTTLAVMTFPAILQETQTPAAGASANTAHCQPGMPCLDPCDWPPSRPMAGRARARLRP